MLSSTPPGPAVPASEAELRLRWLRAQPLLVLAYVIVPGFTAALVVTLVVFGVMLRIDSVVGLVLITGVPVATYVWSMTRKPEWWLTPAAWVRRAVGITAFVCFALLPATGYWAPIQWWVWPLIGTLCLVLPTLAGLLAARARKAFLRPFTGDLGETGFVLEAEVEGFPNPVRLELTELRWRLTGAGAEETLPLKQIEQVTVSQLHQDVTPPHRVLPKADGSGGVVGAQGTVVAVKTRKAAILLPLKEPEAFAEILRRRIAARSELIRNARVTL